MQPRKIFRELCKRPIGMISLGVLVCFYLIALFADFLAPYPTSTQNLDKPFHPPTALTWTSSGLGCKVYQNADAINPDWKPVKNETRSIQWFAEGYDYKFLGFIPANTHLFQLKDSQEGDRIYLLGSDSTGRDVFSRLLKGSQVSLTIGIAGISITLFVGFVVGGLSGYFGGLSDFVAMRFVEFLMAIPGLYLLLSLRAALAPYFKSDQMFYLIVVILAMIGWAGTARVIRGMSLSIRRRPFVQAAESMGQSTWKILFQHILPNLFSYLLVAATLSIPGYILGEAALSFLGLGIQEPAASWGLMLSQAQDMKVFMFNFWWMLTPGFAIFITVIAFNLLGDTLRDIVDPKFQMNRSS
ncbi:MAG: ABC transporter permease [Verrucomicrobiota bacterium]